MSGARLGEEAYKYPREIRFMDELPQGPSGKILKTALRDRWEQEA